MLVLPFAEEMLLLGQKLKVNSDRICALRITCEKEVMFAIAVYLPPARIPNLTIFDVYWMNSMFWYMMNNSSQGDVCIIGDVNCQFGREAGPRGINGIQMESSSIE